MGFSADLAMRAVAWVRQDPSVTVRRRVARACVVLSQERDDGCRTDRERAR